MSGLRDAAPLRERADTLKALRAAGLTEPPRMGARWNASQPVSHLDGWAESYATRREMLADVPPAVAERRIEGAEVCGIELDALDRQPVRLAYLAKDAPEATLEQWVDRQYATGRLAVGYHLVEVRAPGGRPRVGEPVLVRLPAEMLAQIDEAARGTGVSRAEWVRQACSDRLRGGANPH